MSTHILNTHGAMALNIFQLFVGVCTVCVLQKRAVHFLLFFLFLNNKVQRLNTVHLVHNCIDIDIDTDTKCT